MYLVRLCLGYIAAVFASSLFVVLAIMGEYVNEAGEAHLMYLITCGFVAVVAAIPFALILAGFLRLQATGYHHAALGGVVTAILGFGIARALGLLTEGDYEFAIPSFALILIGGALAGLTYRWTAKDNFKPNIEGDNT